MIKVCHLASNHSQDDTRIFHKECSSLAKHGYEVHFVVAGTTGIQNDVFIEGETLKKKNRLWRMFIFSRHIYKRAKSLNADIYHIHDPELLRYATRLKKKDNIVIFDSHENMVGAIGEKAYIPKIIRPLIKSLYEKYQKDVCKKIDAVITATPNMTEYFKQFKETVIDVMNYPILADVIHKSSFDKTLVYAGNFSKQWNLIHAVNALALVPDLKLKLYGNGEKLLPVLEASPGWKQVEYYGRVPHSEIQKALSSATAGIALLSPGANTDYENGNFANTKIFEEMMAGLPVICTNFKRWKEFVNKYKCGICITPDDENEIAKAYQYVIDHYSDMDTMGKNGRVAIEKEFNWSFEEKKLYNLYEYLLKSKS